MTNYTERCLLRCSVMMTWRYFSSRKRCADCLVLLNVVRIVPASTAEETFGVNEGSHLLYLYCDIASFTAVGHAKAPLLRVCNTTGNYGDVIRTIFTHPHYVPVARREIESIEININTELGKPTPFTFGKSVVTLHFRRRHSLLPKS